MFVSVEALKEVTEITAQLQSSLIRLENFQKLTELQRDLIGIENLTAPGRVRVLLYLTRCFLSLSKQKFDKCILIFIYKIAVAHQGFMIKLTV